MARKTTKIKPNKEKIAELEKQHKERIEKYSKEERREAIKRLAGCLKEIEDK